MNDFHYVSVLLDMLYGIELDEEDVEELGLIAWNLIGNKNTRLYKCRLKINPSDLSVTLPCNALSGNNGNSGINGGIVEAVTSDYEDWNRVTNYSFNGDHNTSFIEQSIEAQKYFNDNLYISGKLLKYDQVENKLYFTHNYGHVNILYKGILADENGLPEISDKEATAIATYIAYTQKYKDGLVNNNANTINLATTLYNMWLKQCDQARVTYLNQNDMNQILDAKSSWDRHRYNYTTKPIR